MFMACAILAMLNILLLDPKSKDEEYLESLIEQEKEESSLKRKLIVEEEQREKDSKKKHREALLDELVGGWLWISSTDALCEQTDLHHVFKMLNKYVYDVLKVW